MNSLQIPVKIEEIESILDKEFLADFSNIVFEDIPAEKQLETVFLYFRNTGFKFIPDFSNCSTERVADILTMYLKSEYNVPNKHLQEAWLQLVLRKAGLNAEGILSDALMQELEEKLKNEITELATFILSLPVYGLFLLQLDSYEDDGSISRSNFSDFGCNLYNILQDSRLEEVLQNLQMSGTGLKPKFYNVYFLKQNTPLVDAVKNIQQFGLLAEILKVVKNEQ